MQSASSASVQARPHTWNRMTDWAGWMEDHWPDTNRPGSYRACFRGPQLRLWVTHVDLRGRGHGDRCGTAGSFRWPEWLRTKSNRSTPIRRHSRGLDLRSPAMPDPTLLLSFETRASVEILADIPFHPARDSPGAGGRARGAHRGVVPSIHHRSSGNEYVWQLNSGYP